MNDRGSAGRRRNERRNRPWFYALTSLAVAVVAAAVSWGLVTFSVVERNRFAVVDACARVEASGRLQADLVDNLLYLAGVGPLATRDLDAIRSARARLGNGAFSPEILVDPVGFAQYRLAHGDLDAATKAFWAAHPSREGFLSGLDTRLERAEAGLASDLELAQEKVRAYRAAVDRFPGSVVAAIVDPETVRSRAIDPSRRATLVPGL